MTEDEMEKRREERAKRRALVDRDIGEWETELLVAELTASYEPSVIPPCRVCGGPLSVGAIGGGEPTRWACDNVKLPDGKTDWQHYEGSGFVDRRQDGDERVMELIRRFNETSGASLRGASHG